MPIYEIFCESCGYTGEILIPDPASALVCPACGVSRTRKLMSATSSLTGRSRQGYSGPKAPSCCGHAPSDAGCAGPGSCCGKNP